MKIELRQSWINNFLRCPEQARQERLGLVKQKETSDLLRGNAVHHAIEQAGLEQIHSQTTVGLDVLWDMVDDYIAEHSTAVEVWRHSYEQIVDVPEQLSVERNSFPERTSKSGMTKFGPLWYRVPWSVLSGNGSAPAKGLNCG